MSIQIQNRLRQVLSMTKRRLTPSLCIIDVTINTLWFCLRLSAIVHPKGRLFYVTHRRMWRTLRSIKEKRLYQQQMMTLVMRNRSWTRRQCGPSTDKDGLFFWEGSTLLQGAYVKELNDYPHWTTSQHVIFPLSATREVPLETLSSLSSSQRSSGLMVDADTNPTVISGGRDQVFDNPQRYSSTILNLKIL